MRDRGSGDDGTASFDARFTELFDAHFSRVFRVLDRSADDPALAADLAQEAFIRLYQRGSLPDAPEAWLISVALNLLRNAASTRSRRHRLMTPARGEYAHSDVPAAPDDAVMGSETRARVRAVLDSLPERDRELLLLSADGYGYREIGAALGLNEASVGTLLARARRAFRERCDGDLHAG